MKNTISFFVTTFGLISSFCLGNATFAEESAEEAAIKRIKQEIVKKANSIWQREFEIYRAKAMEAEKRGEFASVSPPKSLKPFKDWDYYYLDGSSMGWFPNKGQEFEKVIVPVGFVTDLASIPQFLWSLGIKPEGSYAFAAVIHDYLYWTQKRSRDEADLIFLYAMEDSKVEESLRKKIYKAVSLAGGSAWESNRKLKEQGERRILRKFPPDFTTTWKEWKSTPGVFWE